MWGSVWGWLGRLGRLLFSGILGALMASAVVVWVLYQQAVVDVQTLLAQPVWATSGRVLSAPMEVWAGMRLSIGQLAADLQSAGYARVHAPVRPGDFQVSTDTIVIVQEDRTRATVRFKKGRVAAVSPGAFVRLRAVELAEMRGPEGISRRPIRIDALPPHVIHAVLAMEDGRFFDHEGVDPIGITRAVIANLSEGAIAQGGSTLTQQLVKNLFLNSERTYERKAREALLAVGLESVRTKDEILELYLNEIYLGQAGSASIAGIDQAARMYFGKTAERLTLGEAAVIAGIISAPNRYSPLRHPERAIARRDLALSRMVEREWISPEEAAKTRELPLQLAPTPTHRRSPWLVEAALERVESSVEQEGVIAGQGWVVRTTLQPALQHVAEGVVAESLAALEAAYPKVSGAEMALVAVRASDGAVLAMVGGKSYATTQFNRVTSGARQIGSTVKPLTYLAALDADHSRGPGTVVEDAPLERVVSGRRWAPKNYDGRYRGEISLRRALADSRNVPAVHLAEAVEMGRLARWWKRLGLSAATALPSAALGSFEATPLELAGAYTVFPNQGEVVTPRFVVDATNAGGEVTFREERRREAVTDPASSWLVTSMLQEVMRSGTGRAAKGFGVTGPAAGKTGTTDDARDAWFVGFTGDIVVAVWVGFDRGKDLGLTGGKAALPAWARFIDAAGLQMALPDPPAGVEKISWCADAFGPAECHPGCETVVEEYVFAEEAPACTSTSSTPLQDAFSRLLGAATEAEEGKPKGDKRPRLFRRNR